MADETLISARRSLHAVAERLLAGPEHRAVGGIALRVVPGGFATAEGPAIRVDGAELVLDEARRVPLVGSAVSLTGCRRRAHHAVCLARAPRTTTAISAPTRFSSITRPPLSSPTGTCSSTQLSGRSRRAARRCCGRSTSTSPSISRT
jgi:hypothetical protein